jgi:D-alanine-D-alanine ligase
LSCGVSMDKERLRQKKVAVLMGGTSSERDISLKSGDAVLRSLQQNGYNAIGIDADNGVAQMLRAEAVEVAYVALHGRYGEDGTIQGLLEILGIPYTGSGVLASALTMDKCTSKLLLDNLNVPTPRYTVCLAGSTFSFPYPFIVKPAHEGSTIGITIVKNEGEVHKALTDAFRYDKKVLIEEYLPGREITVGIVNGETLPIVEVKPSSGFYDYAAKYTKGMTEYSVPADLPPEVAFRASEIALEVWSAFELAGCARIDMILNDDAPNVIDINTSPGMTETSLVPKAWEYQGRTFGQLVEAILTEASLKV